VYQFIVSELLLGIIPLCQWPYYLHCDNSLPGLKQVLVSFSLMKSYISARLFVWYLLLFSFICRVFEHICLGERPSNSCCSVSSWTVTFM